MKKVIEEEETLLGEEVDLIPKETIQGMKEKLAIVKVHKMIAVEEVPLEAIEKVQEVDLEDGETIYLLADVSLAIRLGINPFDVQSVDLIVKSFIY